MIFWSSLSQLEHSSLIVTHLWTSRSHESFCFIFLYLYCISLIFVYLFLYLCFLIYPSVSVYLSVFHIYLHLSCLPYLSPSLLSSISLFSSISISISLVFHIYLHQHNDMYTPLLCICVIIVIYVSLHRYRYISGCLYCWLRWWKWHYCCLWLTALSCIQSALDECFGQCSGGGMGLECGKWFGKNGRY